MKTTQTLRWLIALVAIGSCSRTPGSIGVGADSCIAPPAAEVAAVPAVKMRIVPAVVAPGATAQLEYLVDRDDEGTVSISAGWQCWTGSEWTTTHQLFPSFENGRPSFLKVDPASTTTEESIGLPLPDRAVALDVPEVRPGIYRIIDEVAYSRDGPGVEIQFGWAIVEVGDD